MDGDIMKKMVNGEYFEMTEEEYEAWKAEIDALPPIVDDTAETVVNILMGEVQ